MVKQLTTLARTLYLFLQRRIARSDMRGPAYSAGNPSPYHTCYESHHRSTISWNNLMVGYFNSA